MLCYSIDMERCVAALRKRFGGEWGALIRLHPLLGEKGYRLLDGDKSLSFPAADMTGYPDMADLLAVADVLVTDYSSSMFDFMLTRRPCFLYASDIDAYEGDSRRGVYYSVRDLFFPLGEDNDAFVAAIEGFDTGKYAKGLEDYIAAQGFADDDTAGRQILDWLAKRMQSIYEAEGRS